MEQSKPKRKRTGQPNRSRSEYNDSFKRHVAREHIDTGQSLRAIAKKFGVTTNDVNYWKRRFCSELAEEKNASLMTEQEKKDMQSLQKQLKDIQQKLEFEKMRNFALETLVDLAKEQMDIDLRKNFGAKQPEE